MRLAPIATLLIAACHAAPTSTPSGNTPGDRLEAAAEAAGVVTDPARVDPVGLYARYTDRICVVPGGAGAYRVGALVSYDGGLGCAASGTATRTGDRLAVRFGECRFAARFEGDRVSFPAELPATCASLCTGHATLAALDVDRLSDSPAEAMALRDPNGQALCAPR